MKKSFLSVLILFIAMSFSNNEIKAGPRPPADFYLEFLIKKGYYFKVDHNIIGIVELYGNEGRCLICFGADKLISDLNVEVPFDLNTTLFGLIFILFSLGALIFAIQSKRSKSESKAEE
ncbi:MAG: hypothetical protein COA79_13920 [Planctomycetota bacterium]|nr:MAG: hypothetical protein COA79_13920 [Planctomycetota bacterium]